jgi:hypothetical protein
MSLAVAVAKHATCSPGPGFLPSFTDVQSSAFLLSLLFLFRLAFEAQLALGAQLALDDASWDEM